MLSSQLWKKVNRKHLNPTEFITNKLRWAHLLKGFLQLGHSFSRVNDRDRQDNKDPYNNTSFQNQIKHRLSSSISPWFDFSIPQSSPENFFVAKSKNNAKRNPTLIQTCETNSHNRLPLAALASLVQPFISHFPFGITSGFAGWYSTSMPFA